MTDSSFEQQVQDVVGKMTQGDDGNWQLPEGLDNEAVAYAAKLEKRQRDTRSAYTKSQQKTKALELERDKWLEHYSNSATKSLSEDQASELEELKLTDPDAWRTRLNEIEQQNVGKVTTLAEEIKGEANKLSELELRQQQLETFRTENPNLQITDEVIANDVPPRITRRLENGETSFVDFLQECADYLSKGKVIQQGDKPPATIDLGTKGGQSTPSKAATEADIHLSYKTEVY